MLPASTFSFRPVSHPPGRKHDATPIHGRIKLMGLTYVKASVINPADLKKKLRLRFLVDSGAVYSVVPESHLRKLGITPRGSKTFTLADGTEISRKYGHAVFALKDAEGASPVIFGKEGDSCLLGMVSLEALGYILDPIRRELRPLPMVLG